MSELRFRRVHLGWTQARLAEVAGVTQPFVAKVEAGKIHPPYAKVKALFDALEAGQGSALARAQGAGWTAERLMHKGFAFVKPSQSVGEAIESMRKHGYSQLPVVSGGQCVGSVTEQGLVTVLASAVNPAHVKNKPVSTVMEPAFSTVNPETPLSALSALLADEPAVLVRHADKLVGLVTKIDLLKAVS